MLEQTKYISVYRFLPNVLSGIEVAADTGGIDAGIHGGSVLGDQTTLAPADYTNRFGGPTFLVPIDHGEGFLDLVSDQLTAQLEGGAIEKFASSEAADFFLTIDQHRHDHPATALGQAPRVLQFRRKAK